MKKVVFLRIIFFLIYLEVFGHGSGPELPAELAVHLEGDLLDDRGQLLVLRDRLQVDDLAVENPIKFYISIMEKNALLETETSNNSNSYPFGL